MAECKWFHKWEKPYFGFRICVKCGRTEERVCYGIDAYWQKQTYDHWLKSMKKDMEEEKKLADIWEPKIVAFLCNWCSYAGADLAGVSRFQYPTNIRVIRVPCSGRINPIFILKALQEGADGVLISGCHPGDCHYVSGNLVARRKFALLKNLLQYIGIEPQRVHFSWVSASEGNRFAALVEKISYEIKQLESGTKLARQGLFSTDGQ